MIVLAVRTMAGQAPWSRSPVLVGDFANQTVPMLGYYRDVLTGQANGDAVFSWGMSYGQSFWGTWAQYLANPWNLVVVCFPRPMVAGAAITAHLLTAASAGAAMAAALRRMHRGDPLLALALSIAWGASPYVLMDSHYHPYWTVGPVVLPLVVLTACWVRDGRSSWAVSPVIGALMVANFYTGYMGVLGGGLVVLAWMVAAPHEWPRPARTLVRWGLLGALGAAMSAFVVVPTYAAVRRSAQTDPVPFEAGRPMDWLAAVLPGADTVGRAPSWSLGVVVLMLLVVHLVADRGRRAVVWGLTLLLLLMSFALSPTALVWHGGDVPDGNSFRQAWVAGGAAVFALWHLLAGRADRQEVGGRARHVWPGALTALIVLTVVVVAGTRSPVAARGLLTPAALLGAMTLLVGAAAWDRGRSLSPSPYDSSRSWGRGARKGRMPSRKDGVGGVVVLALVVATTVVGAPTAIDRFRARVGAQAISYGFYPGLSDQVARDLAAGHGPDAGAYVPMQHTTNDPLLLGGVGATGYTTMMPRRVADLLTGLGATPGAAGRRLWSRGNALELATFGVHEATGGERTQARWLPSAGAAASDGGVRWTDVVASGLVADVEQARMARVGAWTKHTCPPGSTRATIDAVGARGRLQTPAETVPLPPRDPSRGSVWTIGLGPSHSVSHRAQGGTPLRVWCHGDAVAQGGEPATITRSGAAFDVPSQGGTALDLVVGTTFTDEWSCRADGIGVETYSRAGLLALRQPQGPVSCRFRPAGGAPGLGISVLAVVIWAIGCLLLARRHRATLAHRRSVGVP